MVYNKIAIVEIKGISNAKVMVDTKERRAFSDDGLFQCWSIVNAKGEVISNGNDITTNYLEVANIRALEYFGLRVIQRHEPFPCSREIKVKKSHTIRRNKFGMIIW